MKTFIYCILMILSLLITTIVLLEVSATTDVALGGINRDAPVKTYQEITIHACPQKVYQVMSDIDHWEEWNHDIEDPKLNGPFKVCGSFDLKREGLNVHSIFHKIIPNRKIGWSGKTCGAFAVHNWSFIQHGNYTTVKVEESVEGWKAYVMRDSCQKGLEQSLQVWLKNLKVEAESRC